MFGIKVPQNRKAIWIGVGIFAALFAINYLTGEYLRYPVIYCATRDTLAPLTAPVFYLLFLAGIAVFVLTLFRGKNWGMAMLVALACAALPFWIDTLFLGFLGCG